MKANQGNTGKYLWLTIAAFVLGSASLVMLLKGIHALAFLVWVVICVLTLVFVWKLTPRVTEPQEPEQRPQNANEQRHPPHRSLEQFPVAPYPEIEQQSPDTSGPTAIAQKRPRVPRSKQSPVSGSEVP